MMIYEVYSYSDATLIGDVLNNISILMTSNAYFNAIRLGLLLGIIVTAVRYFFTKTFDLHYILISCVMFQVLFVPTGTVSIQDIKTDQVVKIEHVPLGIAASMYLTSSLSTAFTKTYDTAFQTVDTSYPTGYMSPLRDLLAARKLINASLNVEQGQNWANYFKSCVIPYEDVIFSTKEIFGGNNILTSLATENQNVFVPYSENGQVTLKSCKDAYTKNKTDAENTYSNTFLPKIQKIYGTEDTDTAQTQLKDAIKYIPALKDTEVTGQQFMLNLWLSKVALLSGELQYDAEIAGGAYGPAILEAIEQRNVDTAAYGSMFGQSLPYLMAGIEIIAYGLTPMAGFLLVLGPFGMRLVMRWLLLPLWVGMWPPLTTLINWFMLKVTAYQLSTISDPISFYGSQHLYSVLSNWYGIAGTLQGLVPAISMTFLTGSYFAFTSLANRFSETQTFDEKKIAPDLRNAPPVLQSQSPYSSDPSRGPHATALPSTTRYSMGKTISHMQSSSQSQLHAAQKQMSAATTSLFQQGFTENGIYNKEKSETFSKQIEGSELENIIDTQGNSFSQSHHLTQAETKAYKKLLGIGLSSGIGKMIGIAGNASFQQSYGIEAKKSEELADSASHAIQNNDQLQIKSARSLNDLVKAGKLDTITHGQTSNKSRNFTKAYNKLASSMERHENTKNIASSISTETSYDPAQLGYMLSEAENHIDPHYRLDRLYHRYIDDTNRLQQEENRVQYRFGLEPNAAHSVAMWNLLQEDALKNPDIHYGLSGHYQYGWSNKNIKPDRYNDPSNLNHEVDSNISSEKKNIEQHASDLEESYQIRHNKFNASWENKDIRKNDLHEIFSHINQERFHLSLQQLNNQSAKNHFDKFLNEALEEKNSFSSKLLRGLTMPYDGIAKQQMLSYLSNRNLQKDFNHYKEEAMQHDFSHDMANIYATNKTLLSTNPESLHILKNRYPNLHHDYQQAKQNIVEQHGQYGEKFIIATKLINGSNAGKYFDLAPKMLQNTDNRSKTIKASIQHAQAKSDANIISELENI